jgi:predicted DNA-binding protein
VLKSAREVSDVAITLELAPDLENRVETLARGTGESPETYLAGILEEVLEDKADLAIVESRKHEPYIPFDDVLAKFESKYGALSSY